MLSRIDIQRFPSVLRFIDHIVTDLMGRESVVMRMQRRSAMVLLPDGIDPLDVSDLLRYELDRRQVQTDLITLADYASLPPLAGLSTHFRLSHVPSSCEDLASEIGMRMPEVLFLEALEQLDEPHRSAWLRLIEQWTQTAHRYANHSEPFGALCVVAPAHCLSPLLVNRTQLFLEVHYWWGVPTPAETQILWRDMGAKVADSDLARWRDHMLPSIAAGDSPLLELFAPCDGRTTEIIDCLKQFALARGWTTAALQCAGGGQVMELEHRHAPLQMRPRPTEEALWGMGALIWTSDYGVELHPATLILLGLHHELEHRLWRAQAGLLLPILDRVRRHICLQLTTCYGPEWPWRYTEPNEEQERLLVRQSPMLCGLGHLAWLLHPHGSLCTQSYWHSLVSQARDLRNRIAHYQLVTLEEYLGLMQNIEQSMRYR